MAILNISDLRLRAAEQVRRNQGESRRLVLIYCGVIAALSLGSSALNLILDSQIGQTGGLDGMGLRAVLGTAEEVLYYINLLFGPFWSAGFLMAMLNMARGGTPRVQDLAAGFRRFGRILGHLAFESLVIITLMIASVNLAAILFSFSSWGAEFEALMLPVLEDPNLIAPDGTLNMALVPMEAMSAALIPMLFLVAVIFLPMYLYLTMGFRMSLYLVMERPIGGAQAHFLSMRLMRGHKWQLLKLDLRYWWYYVLGLAVGALAYLDQILPLVGVELPLNSEALYFLAMGAYCLASLGLSLWKKCEVDSAHILAYEAIAYPEQIGAEC